jgi:ribonuclease HII
MRRALAELRPTPGYVLTDGFPVPGLTAPGLAVWKGDRVAACIAAASVLAKVTRDRMMVALHDRFPAYDFATHKGYITPTHQAALSQYGPCSEHRFSFVNVRSRLYAPGSEMNEVEDNDYVDVTGGFETVVGA